MAELPWEDPNWSQGDELTAQEWVNHVQEGHPEANSDFDVAINANGNYEITHTPSGNSFVLNQDGTLSAPALRADQRLDGPTYATRNDVPDQSGFYAVEDVDGEGNFGVIYREV